MLPSYEEILFKDSGKVLTAIQDILDAVHEALLIPPAAGGTASPLELLELKGILTRISEEIVNASKTSNIIPKTEGPADLEAYAGP